MSKNSIYTKIVEKFTKYKEYNNCLVVLKGIPMSTVSPECDSVRLEDITKNKIAYFMKISSERNFVTYEEFLMLYSFIIEQYDTIVVLNNNIYINQYPLDVEFSDEIRKGLLTHFEESENDNDDTVIGNIDGIINIYNGVKEYNGFLMGSYCETDVLDNIKIKREDLFDDYTKLNFKSIDYDENLEYIDIKNEFEYIDFIKEVFSEPDELYIRIINFTGEDFAKEQLIEHISIFQSEFQDTTEILFVEQKKIEEGFKHRDAYTGILKKYWGYDSFRTFNVF